MMSGIDLFLGHKNAVTPHDECDGVYLQTQNSCISIDPGIGWTRWSYFSSLKLQA